LWLLCLTTNFPDFFSFRFRFCVRNAACAGYDNGSRMQTYLGVSPMKHPVRNDFHVVVTEAGVSVTFKPTNSIYSFQRLADATDIARLGLASFAGVQHAGHDTEDYPPNEVQDMAQRIALEFAASVWFHEGNAPTGSRNTTTDATPRPVSPADARHTGSSGNTKARRVASEVAETLWLIQNLDKGD
jgi:hypothetical protein